MHFRLPESEPLSYIEETEDEECETTLDTLAGSKNDYYRSEIAKTTPRLFQFASTSGEFAVTEIASPLLHPEGSSPFLFLQSDLYSASQPALFLLDAGDCLWLWHGWVEADTAPSAVVRHQAERRAAMQSAIQYWKTKHEDVPMIGKLVWAGLEPIQFTALFPFWEIRDDITILNLEVR